MFPPQKIAYFVVVFMLCFGQNAFATSVQQDTIQKFDVEVFKDSLQELEPKELAFLFLDIHKKDSIKCSDHTQFKQLPRKLDTKVLKLSPMHSNPKQACIHPIL
jgi:hypothetical protein